MADYQTALQQLIAQRQAAQPKPEDIQAADEQTRLGTLLNQLFQSQAMVGNIHGKPTETGNVNFQDYGKQASDQMKQKNQLAQQNFENGLQGQQAMMGADKFASGQAADALNLKQNQFNVNHQQQSYNTDQALKNAQLQEMQNRVDGGDTQAGKDMMESRKVERLRSTLPSIVDPVSKKVAQDTINQYDARKAALEAINVNKQITPGQKSTDSSFGKDYADYIKAGGSADVDKSLEALQAAYDSLSSGKASTGPIQGFLSEHVPSLRNATSPDSVIAQQNVERAATGSVKQLLGSRLTQMEFAKVIQQAYNPGLPVEENKKRIQAMITDIKAKRDSMESAGKSFENNNGSLQGYKATGKTANSKPKTVIQNGHTYILNEQTGQYE